MARVNLILARAANGVIGAGGVMPWHLPEDMAHFKQQTAGAPVIMGRKTWDSLPQRFRPLPGRRNIVVTRQPDWNEKGAQRASSLREALSICEQAPEAWVIGGAQIYAEALPLAQRAIITEIGKAIRRRHLRADLRHRVLARDSAQHARLVERPALQLRHLERR